MNINMVQREVVAGPIPGQLADPLLEALDRLGSHVDVAVREPPQRYVQLQPVEKFPT